MILIFFNHYDSNFVNNHMNNISIIFFLNKTNMNIYISHVYYQPFLPEREHEKHCQHLLHLTNILTR